MVVEHWENKYEVPVMHVAKLISQKFILVDDICVGISTM